MRAIEDERRLIEEARRGDSGAQRALVERHQRRVYAVALGIVHNRDDAKDVTQETFVNVLRSLDRFEGEALFSTWVHRITTNVAIDLLRRRRRQVDYDDATEVEAADDDSGVSPARLGFDPQRALSDGEIRERIRAALARLSPVHRTVLLLREIEGLSYKEMAEVQGCSIGTIMSRLFHARKKMQAHLKENLA